MQSAFTHKRDLHYSSTDSVFSKPDLAGDCPAIGSTGNFFELVMPSLPENWQQKLQSISTTLDQVTSSKDSIISTSQLLLKICDEYPDLTKHIVSLWAFKMTPHPDVQTLPPPTADCEDASIIEMKKFNSSASSKKETDLKLIVSLMFLANELISRSKALELKKLQQIAQQTEKA